MISDPAYRLRAEIYDCFFGDRTAEITAWNKLARQAGPRVVEWMCGTGVLASALAGDGFDVIGVDNVLEMLDIAAAQSQCMNCAGKLSWVLGDIGDVTLPRTDNDFALIAAGSFGHLILESDQLKALKNIRLHLKPGGTLALHLSLAGDHSLPWTTSGPFKAFKPSLNGARVRKVFVKNKYDSQNRIYTIHDKVEIQGNVELRTLEYLFEMRHYTPGEITQLLTNTGFGDIWMYGDYELNPWYPGSPEWIVCAKK